MFDHVGITVTHLERSKAFYDAALGALGIKPTTSFPGWQAYGSPDKAALWVAQGTMGTSKPRVHIAFKADRKGVDAFYAAAMKNGGTDNGAPGLRPHYDVNYYGAFVLDPDGHNIEAVCRTAAHGTRSAAKKKAPVRKPAKTSARKSSNRSSSKPSSSKKRK